MTGKSVLILGATGATGQFLLQELLNCPAYSHVGEYGRRVTSLDEITSGKEKLIQKVIDFENLSESGIKEGRWDVVLITLGARRVKALNAEEFQKIDREYVINVAREAKVDDPSFPQRLIYVSSINAKMDSWFMYPRTKALTEIELANLGYKETGIIRTACLTNINKPEFRIIERVASAIISIRKCWEISHTMECATLAKSMKNAGLLDWSIIEKHSTKNADVPFTLIDNLPARAIADQLT